MLVASMLPPWACAMPSATASPALRPRGCATTRPPAHIEKAGEVLDGKSSALVDDRHAYLPADARRVYPHAAAGGGCLYRVVHEVGQRTVKLRCVDESRQAVLGCAGQPDAAGLGHRVEGRQRVVDQVVDDDALRTQAQRPGMQPGQEKQDVDQLTRGTSWLGAR